MKYLGIDFGSKKVGLALSDDRGVVAFPHAVVENNAQLLTHIEEVIEREGVDEVVIGESTNFNGDHNAIMEEIMDFIGQLSFTITLPIHLEKEYLTTAQARNTPREGEARGHIARKRQGSSDKKDTRADAHAAAIILQSFIDRV